jgi:hypothetical protein
MKNRFDVKKLTKLNFKNPVMIEGLPGMGNVGKIAIDFIIESLDAKKVYDIHYSGFPSFTFVNEKGLVELPKVEIYHKNIKKRDFFFISGDVQPATDENCYEFCDKLLDLFEEYKGKEIITLGGIGLEDAPKQPKIYCAATDKEMIKRLALLGVKSAEGIVGPIIGVSGLLLGLGKQRGMNGAILLAETVAYPNYLGIKEARELLKILNKYYTLGLNIQELNKEVKVIEQEIETKLKKIIRQEEMKQNTVAKKSTDYIG